MININLYFRLIKLMNQLATLWLYSSATESVSITALWPPTYRLHGVSNTGLKFIMYLRIKIYCNLLLANQLATQIDNSVQLPVFVVISLHGFFNPPEENLPAGKRYTDEWDCYSIQLNKEAGPKIGCFAGFCHHRLTSMNVCAYACVSLSFVQKWNEDRFKNDRFMQKIQSTIASYYLNTSKNSNIKTLNDIPCAMAS